MCLLLCMLQRVAACCSVLQRVAACCSDSNVHAEGSHAICVCTQISRRAYIYTYFHVYVRICRILMSLKLGECRIDNGMYI